MVPNKSTTFSYDNWTSEIERRYQVREIELTINSQKTEYMSLNNPQGNLVDTSGASLSQVTDFQYLGSWVESTKKDVEVRIAKAWAACSKLNNVWQSDLSKDLKINLFRAAVESVLLYGSESWTMTDTLSKRIDGTYTRLLRTALNVSWRQHLTNRQLYGNLPPVSSVIQVRRLQFAGHFYRSKNEVVNRVILCEPSHGRRSKGRPAKSYINILAADTGAERSELPGLMGNREQWKAIVDSARARSTERERSSQF